jgi:hypothetical protein
MAKCFTNVSQGIVLMTDPYEFVPVGNELGKHVRVTLGKQTPPQYASRDVPGMRFKRAFIDAASIMHPKPKPRAEGEEEGRKRAQWRDNVFLINEQESDTHTALVLASLPSGYHGDAVISVHDRAQIVADCFVPHGMRGQMHGVTHYALAYLAPGGELRGRATGHRLKAPCARWVFDGVEMLYIDGGEDIFYSATEYASQLQPAE